MALKSDAYGFLVGAPVEWGRALQIFTEIRDEVRGLRSDIAGGASIKALERAADAVSRQASTSARASTKAAAATPTRAAPARGANGRFVSATPVAPARTAALRGPNGRFISSSPAPGPRRPYRIPVIGVEEVATPARPTGTLTAEEFEARRARAARPSSRDEIRRQNAQMAQARPAPLDADAKTERTVGTPEQRAADRATKQAARQEAREAQRAEARAARADEREKAKGERDAARQKKTEEREAAKLASEPGLASKAYDAVGSAPEIDPAITAVHEVQAAIAPVGRGLSRLFGTGGQDAWYKRIWKELVGQRKDQSTYHKAEQKTLQQIDDKTGGSSGGGLLGGLLGKIPGVGLLGRVLGAGASGIGSIASLAMRGGKGLFRRLPLLGALFAGGSAAASIAGFGDDPNASPEENREKRFTGAGSGIGALIGGGLGTLVGGPIGSVIGGMIGDKVGELVGK
ncbi:hypothetical protein QYH69_07765 [Paraburkholderia sp. SARCC-3016]|uniref:hypothetical protein n=1 Tax=Paraburkholderia sp. SARCC-3016 TaxID=3058611 RepID=UPI002807E824|nr:hypothetical protein [Paraburkholderia sp. SARCC-3016]MDQ7977142.1 hypothetical protein [Paraburkholderia sp. SARCC-3016]